MEGYLSFIRLAMVHQILDKIFSNKKLIRPAEFIVKMAIVYACWRTFKYFGEKDDNFLWGSWFWFKNFIGDSVVASAAAILSAAGYELTYYKRLITLEGGRGIYFADLCLGIAPMVIFSGFIISYGNNLKNKLWFIPMGLMFIHVINIFRIIALVLIQAYYLQYFKFAHDYLYVVITYGLIFLLVMWWMDKLADKPANDLPKQA